MAQAKIVSSPPVHQLRIAGAFSGLSSQEKRYAHYLSRAAWHGTRIVLRQVSPEAIDIYDFILGVAESCLGDWDALVAENRIGQPDLDAFLNYSATFLSNIGNYYGQGDQKFVPDVPLESLKKLSGGSSALEELLGSISGPMTAVPPYALGFPGDGAQSAYYPGPGSIARDEIEIVSRTLEQRSVFPENTRIRKTAGDPPSYDVLQASVETQAPEVVASLQHGAEIRVVRGDHSKELAEICANLSEAARHASNETQKRFLSQYVESFQTGSLEAYRDSQRTWIRDKNPSVENIFGFVEPYRDPYGTRAEFEGLVAISDAEETKALLRLVEASDTFVKRLPWVQQGTTDNGGKGPFEKALFEPPDFTSIHALAYCSSIVFPGINLPNYNDIRQECGFKNVIIANRMDAESSTSEICPFLDPSEAETFQKHKYPAYYWWVVLHELLGHGTGRMMVEETGGRFNFDAREPPVDPLTGKPIASWYKPGQTWTGQFGDLATTVDECRAELVGAYLMDDTELLSLFGFDDQSEITAEELTYNLYLQLGVDGLRGLANFNPENGTWGQAHSRAHFAMLNCLLTDGGDFMSVDCSKTSNKLTVHVDRSRISSHGKPALGRMLLRLHMYRCTADVAACRAYYEALSSVEGKYLEWRDVVLANQRPRWVYVQANTFLSDKEGEVVVKEYEPNVKGVIQSWLERKV